MFIQWGSSVRKPFRSALLCHYITFGRWISMRAANKIHETIYTANNGANETRREKKENVSKLCRTTLLCEWFAINFCLILITVFKDHTNDDDNSQCDQFDYRVVRAHTLTQYVPSNVWRLSKEKKNICICKWPQKQQKNTTTVYFLFINVNKSFQSIEIQ